MNEIKGTKIDHSWVGNFWEQSGESDNLWLYYNSPLIWEFQLPAAQGNMRGVAFWSDSTTTDGVADYQRVRYHLYMFHDFVGFRQAVYDRNELIRPWLEKADCIYAVDTCEIGEFKIHDVRLVEFGDIEEDDKPRPDATIHASEDDK